MGSRAYVMFHVGGASCALPREHVHKILPLPAVARPPGLPAVVEGILDLAGTAVPVLRLAQMFGLTAVPLHAYRHLILLNCEPPLALLVDQATGVLKVAAGAIAPLHLGETLNGCVVGQIAATDAPIQVLSLERLLDQRERHVLAEFQAVQQRRLEELAAS
jgi:purine-binding chemotaxis protein CheW